MSTDIPGVTEFRCHRHGLIAQGPDSQIIEAVGRSHQAWCDGSPEGTDPPAGEPRYTLEEATQILRGKVCADKGHTLTVVVDATQDPTSLLCTICGKQGPVDWPAT
jgi:hypothetical protein